MSDSKAFSPSANKMDGMCECGCGEPAPIARRTDSRCGIVKGQPQRFILGHANRGRTKVQKLAEKEEKREGKRQRIKFMLDALSDACLKIEGQALSALLSPLVYVFYEKEECLYVGSGSSAGRPFSANHHKRSDLTRADRILLYPCESRKDAFVLEQSLIAKLKPQGSPSIRPYGVTKKPAIVFSHERADRERRCSILARTGP